MSAELDGIVELVGDVAAATGAIVKGIAVGVFRGAEALAKMSLYAAQAAGTAAADAFKEMREIHKIAAEEKKRHREAYEAYVDSLEADEIRRKEYITKLERMVPFDALGIDYPAKNKIGSLEDGERIGVYNNLINLQSKFNEMSDVFFGLAEQGVESDGEYEFYKLKKRLAETVNGGNYDFDDIFSCLENLLSRIRELKSAVANEETVKFIEAQLFKIENDLGNPLLTGFHSELYEMLRLPKEQPDSAENKLLAVEKEVLELVRLFGNFNYDFDEKEEFENLLSSVKSIILSDDSAETKLQLADLRYRRMKDLYEKVLIRHSEVIEMKRRYNEIISLNYNLREYLSMPLPQFAFDYRTAAAEIARLSAENAELSKAAEARRKREYIRKSVRETMKELQFEYLCSQTAAFKEGEPVEKDVYHIENGNVVSVSFSKDKVCCSVRGVKLDGISENKGSVVRSMKKLCSQKDRISEKLKSKGVSIEFYECIEADERYAREITLKDAPASAIETIRKAKLKIKRSVSGIKKKTIN